MPSIFKMHFYKYLLFVRSSIFHESLNPAVPYILTIQTLLKYVFKDKNTRPFQLYSLFHPKVSQQLDGLLTLFIASFVLLFFAVFD